MLDIHAPEHPISSKREFFLHLFTITCGLLIALALENAAEALHHRHQRREAEEKIRQEIKNNLDGLAKDEPGLIAESSTMKQFISLMQSVQHGERLDHQELKLEFHEGEIPDAAWRTASSTGVLEYMPYDEVEQFADAYREQALLQGMAQRTLNDYLELTPMLDHKPSAEEATEILRVARRTMGDLNGIFAAGNGTVAAYKAALK